jgi:hypothetical protein
VRGDQALRFTEFEEAIFHLEQRTGPWNIQLEVEAGAGSTRSGCATRSARRAHVIPSRARGLRYWAGGHRAYQWFVPDALDLDPLTVVGYIDEAQLAEARSRLYSPEIPLDISPPIRVQLARGAERDLVMFDFSHVVTDGIGCVRFLQSVARAYRGDADPEDPLGTASARDVDRNMKPTARARSRAARSRGERGSARHLTRRRGSRQTRAGCPGFGFVARKLTVDATSELLARRPPARR